MEVYSRTISKIKSVLNITSILLLTWSIFSKIGGMDEAASFLLSLSGVIRGFMLIAELLYRRLVKWSSRIEGPSLDEFIDDAIRRYEEVNSARKYPKTN